VTAAEEPAGRQRFGVLGALYERFKLLLQEIAKFGMVGAVAFVVDTGLFNVFYPVGTLTAKVLSTLIATTVAFAGNKFWTFRHRKNSGLAKEYFLFFVFNGLGLLIQMLCLGFSHYWLGDMWPDVFRTRLADNVSANIVGTGLGMLFRFWSYRRWVFLPADAPPVDPHTGLPQEDDDADA
jgi:putative flippase GtrA